MSCTAGFPQPSAPYSATSRIAWPASVLNGKLADDEHQAQAQGCSSEWRDSHVRSADWLAVATQIDVSAAP